jgi:dihydroorotate dehydrogenase (NAD+) catalytic subunit
MLDEPGTALNAIGVANPGVARWAETTLPSMLDAGVAVVASVWGTGPDRLVAAAEVLSRYSGPIAWELNLSCPNAEDGGAPVSHDAERSSDVCRAVRSLAPDAVGVWAKLSPDAMDVAEVALACHDAGADAVTISNTYPAAQAGAAGRTGLGGGPGGISGARLRQYVRPLVEKVASTYPELPVIASGGVLSSEIALDYLRLGARAVQVGTATLYDPRACHKIARALVRKLQRAAR